jgi:hypothetical protein
MNLPGDELEFGSVTGIGSIMGRVSNGLGKTPVRWSGRLGCALRKPLGLTRPGRRPHAREGREARLCRLCEIRSMANGKLEKAF